MNRAEQLFANIPWKTKIVGLIASFIFANLVISASIGWLIDQRNQDTQHRITGALEKLRAATTARESIIRMSAAKASLIAANEASNIRQAAIASIRASSMLDESIQRLKGSLPGEARVKQLAELLKRMRPGELKVIKFGKKNLDDKAREASEALRADANKVSRLANELVASEEQAMANSTAAAVGATRQTLLTGGIALAAVMLAALVIAWIAANLLTNPLKRISDGIRELASGNLAIQIAPGGRDETGQTLSGLSTTIANLHDMVERLRNRTAQITAESDQLDQMSSGITDLSTRIHHSVQAIQTETSVVSTATDNATSELTASAAITQQSAEAASESAEQINIITESFTGFQREMDHTMSLTHELAQAAETITNVVGTVSSISEQTNLLALNAAIEAARAGEHGRGFAVVADEVRHLAANTREATDQIRELAETISSGVGSTVSSLEHALQDAQGNIDKLQAISHSSHESSKHAQSLRKRMQGVVDLMSKQQQAVTAITSALDELAQLSQTSSTNATTLQASSQTLNDSAMELNEAVQQFTL